MQFIHSNYFIFGCSLVEFFGPGYSNAFGPIDRVAPGQIVNENSSKNDTSDVLCNRF